MDEKIKHAILEARIKAMVMEAAADSTKGKNVSLWDDIEKRKEERNFVTNSDIATAIKKACNRCGWEIVDIYKKEGDNYLFYAIPNFDGKRVVDFGMVCASVTDNFADKYKISPKSLRPDRSETEGVHIIVVMPR